MDCFKFKVAKYPPKRRGGGGFEGAMEAGMSLAGLEKTKAGHDDKEIAYIVRQNWCFRTIFCLFIFICVGLGFIFTTTLRVEVFRREAIDQEVKHRVTEHGAQVKLLSVRVELKNSLEEQIHQFHRVEEFRSYLERLLGDKQNKMKQTSGNKRSALPQLIKYFDEVGDEAIPELDRLLKDFAINMDDAKKKLTTISSSIVKDIEEDNLEHSLYLKKLSEFGANKKEVEKLGKLGLNQLKFKDRAEGSHFEDVEKQKKESFNNVEVSLLEFFNKVQMLKFPVISPKVIQSWEDYLASIIETLSDPEKETDLESIKQRVKMMIYTVNPEVDKYSEESGMSIVDYLKMRIYEAKLASHKQELLALQDKWKKGELNTIQVLSKVEQVALEHLDKWMSS